MNNLKWKIVNQNSKLFTIQKNILITLICLFFLLQFGLVSGEENSGSIFFFEEKIINNSGQLEIQQTSTLLEEPYSVKLYDYSTGELYLEFNLTTSYQGVEVDSGKYIVFIEQGTEEFLLDNNGTGYSPGDTVIIPTYCVPSLAGCWVEDKFYFDLPWRLEPGMNIPIYGIINTDENIYSTSLKIKYIRLFDTNNNDNIVDEKVFSPPHLLYETG